MRRCWSNRAGTPYGAEVTSSPWPAAALIQTERLVLEPLRVDHAEEVAAALDDQGLHDFIGGHPATVDQLRERYTRLVVGHSADGSQGWCNWIARERRSSLVVGTVQATVQRERWGGVAQLAWMVAMPYQGRGYATESAAAMCDWLRDHGVDVLVAHVHPDHLASIGVARRLDLRPSDVVVDGEIRWTSEHAAGGHVLGARTRGAPGLR